MKQLTVILVVLLSISILGAFTFEYDGEFRARAAMYNDSAENNGGHIDNRFQLGMGAMLNPDLKLYAKVEFSDLSKGMIWGEGGAGLGTKAGIHALEAYIDYRIACIQSNIRVGQQYWADHASLVLDDTFSGIMISKDDLFGMKAQAGWLKIRERILSDNDDYNVFLVDVTNENFPYGLSAMYGDNNGDQNVTIMPWVTLDVKPVELDVTAFVDYQILPGDDGLGLGAAAKAKMDLGVAEVGLNALFATEDGLTILSPYYQNGLYIYGYGPHHDGVNLYWGDDYQAGTPGVDGFLSLVATVKAPLCQRAKLFAAAGMLVDIGMEVNAGIEYEIIPDLFNMAAYGAFGIHDNDTNNYLFGITGKVNF